MITDKQGKEWLLQNLYDDGWRYLVMDVYGNVYLTNEIPRMQADTNKWQVSSCKKAIGASAFKNILPNMNNNELVSIAEELGIVDWSKVEVDTPVFVRDGIDEVWKCRYFAEYKDGKVYTWRDGKTSWSNVISDRPVVWGYAELAFKE